MAKRPRHSVEVRRFQRAAVQRFEEATYLLDPRQNFGTAAVYLAGYGVECALKALLVSTVPVMRQSVLVASFRGAKAHDFEWLREQLLRNGVPLPAPILRALSSVSWWATDLRYTPRMVPRRKAEGFVRDVNVILDWVKGRL